MTVVDLKEPAERDRVVPLFPLAGALLLPGNFLPLNIFEPRYRNLVEDAQAEGRRIGMIQPRVPERVPAGPPGPEEGGSCAIYEIGCLGRLTRCERQPDGRFLILLEGERRFRVERELPLRRGYRRALAGFDEFAADAQEDESLRGEELLRQALDFAHRFELEFDPDLLAALTPGRLVNVLAAALPFGVLEKQALLEAPTVEARQKMLLALMAMTPVEGSPPDLETAEIVH